MLEKMKGAVLAAAILLGSHVHAMMPEDAQQETEVLTTANTGIPASTHTHRALLHYAKVFSPTLQALTSEQIANSPVHKSLLVAFLARWGDENARATGMRDMLESTRGTLRLVFEEPMAGQTRIYRFTEGNVVVPLENDLQRLALEYGAVLIPAFRNTRPGQIIGNDHRRGMLRANAGVDFSNDHVYTRLIDNLARQIARARGLNIPPYVQQ